MYGVGQIVCSGFSVRCYGQSWTFWPTQSLIRWCFSAWEEKQMSAWYRLRIAVFLWLGAHPGLHLRLYSVQFSPVTQLCPTLCDPMNRSTPGLPVHHQLLEFTQTHAHRVGDAIQPSHPLLSPSSPAPNPSQHHGLSNELTLCMRWPKYWSFSFSISPSSEHPGLISFRIDWLDLLAAQGTLKSLLQHHGSKASILWRSAFFTVQLSHPYMTTGKNIALTRWTFVGKVLSLLLNMLSILVITFLPSSKSLLISWLQSPSAVILEPKKIKSDRKEQLAVVLPGTPWEEQLWDQVETLGTR